MNNTPDNNTNIPAGSNKRSSPLLKVLPRDPDRAYVQINLSWMDNRPGLDTGASTPAADAYSVTVRGDIN